jgi:uncharacterized protein (TIGR03435 family)
MVRHIRPGAKLISVLAALIPIAIAQAPSAPPAPQPPLAFDVVSIRPAKVENVVKGDIEYHMSVFRTMDDGYSAENVPVLALIADAYHVKADAITGGPDWVRSDSYNVSAKITAEDGAAPPKLTTAQRRKMMQALLAERFKLALHPETKESTVYNLVVASGGSLLHPTAPGNSSAAAKGFSGYPQYTAHGRVKGESVTLASLADFLQIELHRPVTDKTGLTGKYDIQLQWATESTSAQADASATTSGPSLFTAVEEQLGLKLVSAKGPVTTLAIDHIERPSEN